MFVSRENLYELEIFFWGQVRGKENIMIHATFFNVKSEKKIPLSNPAGSRAYILKSSKTASHDFSHHARNFLWFWYIYHVAPQIIFGQKIDFFDEKLLCHKTFLHKTLPSKSLSGMLKRRLEPVFRSLAILMTFIFFRGKPVKTMILNSWFSMVFREKKHKS